MPRMIKSNKTGRIAIKLIWILYMILLVILFSKTDLIKTVIGKMNIPKNSFQITYLGICSVLIGVIFFTKRRAGVFAENNYKKNKGVVQFFLDLLWIFELFIVLSDWNGYLFYIKSYRELYYEFIRTVLSLFYMLYLLNSIIKNIIQTNYIMIGIIILLAYVAGWVNISNWGFISLVIVVVNQLLKYDDAKLIYKTRFLKRNEIEIDDEKSKSNFVFYQIIFNMLIVALYFVIAATEKINILETVVKILNHNMGTSPNVLIVIFRGTDRILLIFLLVLIMKLFMKSKTYKKFQFFAEKKFENLFVNNLRK